VKISSACLLGGHSLKFRLYLLLVAMVLVTRCKQVSPGWVSMHHGHKYSLHALGPAHAIYKACTTLLFVTTTARAYRGGATYHRTCLWQLHRGYYGYGQTLSQ